MEPSQQRGRPAMNVALSPDEIARACADAMWKEDDASKGLGMKIVEIKPGQATLTMTVQPHMVNGQRIAHGGFIFLLADSTFAFACNSRNRARGRRAMRHRLHPAGQAWRRAGRDRAGNLAQRAVRDLRRPRYIRRRRDRRVPRSFPHHRRHVAAGCGHDGQIRIDTGKRAWLRQACNPASNQLPPRTGRGRTRLARRDHGAADQASRLVAQARL